MSAYKGVRDADVPTEITRRRGGYQVKTAPGGGTDLLVKGGRLKGWLRLTLAEARRRFVIPAPTQEAP